MKRIISLILSIAMLATLMPTMLVGAADEEVIILPITEDAPLVYEYNYLGSGSNYCEHQGGKDGYAYLRNVPNDSSRVYLVSKVNVGSLAEKLGAGKAITKVEFCQALLPNGAAVNRTYNFYAASTNWNESDITLNKWRDNGLSPKLEGYYADIIATPDNSTAVSFPTVQEPAMYTYDITSTFERAMASGITPDSQFSFVSAFASYGEYAYPIFALKEFENEAAHPYIKVTVGDIPPATVVSEALPSNPADDLSISLSDNILNAVVSVNGQDAASYITVNGKSFNLDYDFAPSTDYSVLVNITDVNGKALNKTYNFTTNDGNSSTSTAKIYISEDVRLTNAADAGVTNAFCANGYSGQGGLLFKAPLGSINTPEDKKITKVEFKYSCVAGNNRDYACPLYIYNASTAWVENTVTVASFMDGTYFPQLNQTTQHYGDSDTANADVTTTVPLSSVRPSDEAPVHFSADITNVFLKAYPTGEVTGDGMLSFYMHTRGPEYDYFTVAMSEHSNTAARPYLEITFDTIPELTVTSEVIPEKPEDVFSLTMSNLIKEATITVNNENVASVVDQYTLSFDYEYATLTKYDVVVNITDVFNNNFQKTYSFTTSYETTTTETLVPYAYHIKDGGAELVTSVGSAISQSGGVIVYQATLPTIPAGSYLDKFELSFWDAPGSQNKAPHIKVYEYSSDEYDSNGYVYVDELTLSDVSACLSDGNIVSDVYYNGSVAWNGSDNSAYKANNYRVDATEYANRCIAEGKEEIYFIVYCDYTIQLLGANANMDGDYSRAYKTAVCSSVNSNPLIAVANADVAVSGATVKKVGVKLATRFDTAVEENMHLYDANGNEIENVPFAYNFYNGEIYLSQPIVLEEGATYTLRLEGEFEDIYGNKETLDLEVASFTTEYDFVDYGIKILAKDAEHTNEAFAAAATLTSANVGDIIQGHWRIDNNIMAEKALIVAIAAYNSYNELVGVQFSSFDAQAEESKVYRTSELTVPETATTIKAFGWDGITFANLADIVTIPVQ